MNETRLTIELDRETKNRFKGKSSTEGKTMKEKLLDWINAYISNMSQDF